MTQANTVEANLADLETLHIKDSVTFFLVSCVCHRSQTESNDYHRDILERVYISGGDLLEYHSLTKYAYTWLNECLFQGCFKRILGEA